MAQASRAVRPRRRKLALSKAQADKEEAKDKESMAKRNVVLQKEDYLKLLEKNLGLYAKTAKEMGISRRTPQRWRLDDKEFNDKCLEIQFNKLDIVEGHLLKNITEGNFQAQRFYLKCKGNLTPQGDMPEGWVERIEIAGAPDAPLNINASVHLIRDEVSDMGLVKALARAMAIAPDLFTDLEDDDK